MERRLAAILAADVVGYSRLVRADEEGTITALQALQVDLIELKFAEHRGRIVKLMGDGILVEFASVVDAVRAATEFQKAMAQRNKTLPEEQRFVFRIGVNLGDVVIDGDDIQGDGVNVAARLEALAEPGGICIADSVYEQVRDRLDLTFTDSGAHQVKNIDRPVHVYRVSDDDDPRSLDNTVKLRPRPFVRLAVVMATMVAIACAVWWWIERPDFTPVAASDMALSLPEGPSIAVLPFNYHGADPEQSGYLADGLTENITAYLAQVPDMLVIARNSASIYRDQPTDVREVSKRFGVRYVLEGSLQKAEDKIRVTAQLIDAVNGKHLWADTYDRNAADLFKVQDEITLHIMREIFGEALEGDQSARRGTKNIGAFTEYLKGRRARLELTPDALRTAAAHFKNALALDPHYTDTLAEMSFLVSQQGKFANGEKRLQLFKNAEMLATKALSIDSEHAPSLSRLAIVRLAQKRFDETRRLINRSLELAPNDANIVFTAGYVTSYLGDAKASLFYFEKANRLHPTPAFWHLSEQAFAYTYAGEYDKAVELTLEAISLAPEFWRVPYMRWMIITHWLKGDREQAGIWMRRVLRITPNWSVASGRNSPFWDFYAKPDLKNQAIDAMRDLGLPESPPEAKSGRD